MSSEMERVLAGGGGTHMSLRPSRPRPHASVGDRAGAIAALLEANRALSTTLDLEGAVSGALEALNRHSGVSRSEATLLLPDGGELIVEGSAEPAQTRPVSRDHQAVWVPVIVGGQVIGALTADLEGEAGAASEHAEDMLLAVAELIAQALILRDLLTHANGHGRGGNQEEVEPSDDGFAQRSPLGSLSDLVSAFEKSLIENALDATRGNRAKAARLLQTTERILGYRIQQYAIDWKSFRR